MKKMMLVLFAIMLTLPTLSFADPINAAILDDGIAGSIQDIATLQDSIAISGTQGIYLWHPESDEYAMLLATDSYPATSSFSLLGWKDQLFIIDIESGSFYHITDKQAVFVYQLPEDVFFYTDQGELIPKTLINCVATGETLYLLLNSFTFENGDTYELYSLESDFQSVILLNIKNIRELWATDNEKLLVSYLVDDTMHPCLLDPITLSSSYIWSDIDAGQGAGFDLSTDGNTLYYTADSGKVYLKEMDQPSRICAYLPFKYQFTTDIGMLWNDESYAYLSNGSLFLREIHETDMGTVTLTIMGTPDAEIIQQFAAQHPDISINLQDRSEDMLALQQSIVSADGSVDLYIVASDGVYADIREKNYAASLNASDKLMEYVSSYYPWVQNTLMSGDQLIAMPASVSVEHWTFNRTKWEELGLGDPPTTLDELFAISEIWQSDYAYDNDDYCLFACLNGLESVLQDIVRQYLLEHETWDQPVSFDTDEFRQAVSAAWEHRDTFISDGEDLPLLMSYPQYFGSGSNDSDIVESFIPPALAGTSPQVIRATMDLLILNPVSKHKDEALIFLEFYASSLDNITRYRIDSSCTEPIRASWYETAHQNRLEQIARLQLQLDETEDFNTRLDIQDSIEALLQQAQMSEETDWEISAEDINIYHGIAEHVKIPLRTVYPKDSSAKAQSFDEIISRFASGQMPVDQFIKQLDEKARMIYSEMN